MSEGDTSEKIFRDIKVAFALLTRLPTPAVKAPVGAEAAWAYPVAGIGLAVLAGCVAHLALWLGLGATIAAALTLGALAFMTGGLHEDGLADSADGLWGGWTRERRLEIMKDSQIGAYGVLALVFTIMLRVLALSALFSQGLVFGGLLVAAVVSRVAMLTVMYALPNARATGLSQATGRPAPRAIGIGFFMAFAVTLWVAPTSVPLMLIALVALVFWFAKTAEAKIGGQTGDILGATQQLAEVTVLLALVANL